MMRAKRIAAILLPLSSREVIECTMSHPVCEVVPDNAALVDTRQNRLTVPRSGRSRLMRFNT
jgi:hypothetical protein